MLYHVYELQHAAFAPARIALETVREAFSNPYMPTSYTSTAKRVVASCELMERATRRYGKPEFGLHTTKIDGKEVAVTEVPVLAYRFCELIHFQRDTTRQDPKVLIVAPLSGHYATLLRGTVEAFLPDFDVYITDWINARDVAAAAGPFDLDTYIDYVIDFARALGPDVHVVAVCQPSVPVMAAVSLMAEDGNPDKPRSMTLMGGPIDTRINPTQPCKLAKSHPIEWFEKSVVHRVPVTYPGFMRRVYPGFLQLTGFMSMNLDRHIGAHVELFNHMIEGDGDSAEAHRTFYDEYMSVMDLPAEYYIQTLETVFMDHKLPTGTMTHYNRPVRPEAITETALMTVEGEKDDISGVGQTKAAHDLCKNLPDAKRAHREQPRVGHYGIFNGRRWREEIYPEVRAFMLKNA